MAVGKKRMVVSVREMAQAVGDDLVEVVGSADQTVDRPVRVDRFEPGAVAFCTARGDALRDVAARCAGGVLVCAPLEGLADLAGAGTAFLTVRDPRLSFSRILAALFAPPPPPPGIHPTAVVHPEAEIDPTASIGAHVVLDRCSVGAGTVIHPHCHLYDDVRVGRNCLIHSGTMIGPDGFGYQRNADGVAEKFPQLGGVTIEDNVEIGANTVIDRGALSDTIIRSGAKIDNLVHISHNCDIGRDAFVIAHAMVGGSTVVGDRSWVAPCASLINGIRVGSDVTVGMAAVVIRDVPDGLTVMGAPARPSEETRRLMSALGRLARPAADE